MVLLLCSIKMLGEKFPCGIGFIRSHGIGLISSVQHKCQQNLRKHVKSMTVSKVSKLDHPYYKRAGVFKIVYFKSQVILACTFFQLNLFLRYLLRRLLTCQIWHQNFKTRTIIAHPLRLSLNADKTRKPVRSEGVFKND